MKINTKKTNQKTTKKIEKKISDTFWKPYDINTICVSQICRQLAFGEGAICWLFKEPNQTLIVFPESIIWALTFLVLYFILDIFQYLFATVLYYSAAKFCEYLCEIDVIKTEEDVKSPPGINFLPKLCFYLKLISLLLASLFILSNFPNLVA